MIQNKYKSLIFAPLPPPVGGVASIVAMLHKGLEDRSDVFFASPVSKSAEWRAIFSRPLRNLFRLVFAVLKVQPGGRVLFFSSEAASFYEKIAWSILVLILGRKPVLFMVSGLFPQFWDGLNSIHKKIFVCILNKKSITLVAQTERWFHYYRSIFALAVINQASATAAQAFLSHPKSALSSRNPHHLVYVGWIIPDKGIFDLLDAMVILARVQPDVRLRLIGPLFNKEKNWKQEVANRGILNNVEFLGSISDQKNIIHELDSASIFVFPSHFEGFPVALLEAITMGLPCVGTNVGGIPDILDDGAAGILVEPRAPQQLADALYKLIIDKELREKISMLALRRGNEVYSHSKFIDSFKLLLDLK